MEVRSLRKLKKYTPTKLMVKSSHYDKQMADFAVSFIEELLIAKLIEYENQ